MPKFNEIQVGDKAHLNRIITKADIETFAALTGDKNPLHLDPEYVKKTDLGVPVAHGMLTASFLSTLIGMVIPGEGSIITNVKLDFKKPVIVNDALDATIEVTKKIHLSRHIFVKATVTNQHAEVVAAGVLKSICPD